MNKKWKIFEQLTEACYMNMIGAEKDFGCWFHGYEVLRDIIVEERVKNPDFAPELYQLDEDTDYAYDVQGWLQDCLDELDMRKEYNCLLEMLDELLTLFQWKEESPSELRFMKSSALSSLGRNEESVEFVKTWLEQEPDNMAAVSAAVYAYLKIHNEEIADELITKHIKTDTECNEENVILFTAASKYYQEIGNSKEQKRIDEKIEEYEKKLEEFYMEGEEFDEDLWLAEDLPFM